MSEQTQQKPPVKWYNFVIISLAAGFLIIGVHQTVTLGFEVSYWLFMLSISLLLLNWMIRNTGNERPKKEKKNILNARSDKKKKKKRASEANMNRRAKRYMNKIK